MKNTLHPSSPFTTPVKRYGCISLFNPLFEVVRNLRVLLFIMGLNFSVFPVFAQGDDCATATQITDVANYCSADGAFTNAGSTKSGFADAPCWTNPGTNEVWFTFTAIGTDAYITITGLTAAKVALYSGSCTGTLSQLVCVNETAGTAAELYASGLSAGTTYFIRISSTVAAKFKLCLNSYNPPVNPKADCDGATKLCSKSAVSITKFSGTGTRAESGGCVTAESNSLWYTWTCGTAGTLLFDIIPSNGTNDIDFVLFELSGTDPCTGRTVVRCNVCSCLDGYRGPGTTGLSPTAPNATENSNCGGLGGGTNAYSSQLTMVAGRSYALLINNANGTDGYTLNFGGTGTFKGADPQIVPDKTVICTGESVSYDGNTSRGYDQLTWNFISGGGTPSSATGPGPHSVTYTTAGTFTAILDATLAGCPKATKAVSIQVKQSPTAPVASSANICQGSTLQLNSTASTGAYSWTGPGGFTSGVQNPAIANAQSSHSGSYSVKATLNGCVSPLSSVNVTVVPPKNPGLDNTVTICSSQASVNLFTSLGGTPESGGVWAAVGTAPTGYSGGSMLSTTGVTPGTYQFRYSFTGNVPCPDVSATVTLTINKAANAGADKTWNVCGSDTVLDLKTQLSAAAQTGGTWSKSGSFGGNLDPATGVFDTQGIPEGTFKFIYTVAATAPCTTDVAEITLKTVRRPNAGQDFTFAPVCQSVGSLDVFGALGSDADAGGTWTGPVAVQGGSVIVSSIKGNYTLTYTSKSTTQSVCPNDQAVIKFTVNDPPQFTVDPVLCNSTNDKISVKVNITGGKAGTYVVTFNPAVSGTLSGSIYQSGPINPGTYTITVTDVNGCTPIATQTVSKVCNCTSDAGEMTPVTAPLRICGTGPATGSHKSGTEFKDGNDVLSYVLHDSPNSNLGHLYARSTNPSFSLDFAAGMQYNTTYYISAIVGNNDGQGQVDLANTNFCNSVAAGQPVIWRELPTISMSVAPTAICLGSSADLTFVFTGNAPFTVDLANGNSITGLSQSNNTSAVSPTVPGIYSYTGNQVIDTYGCVTGFSTVSTLNVFDSPVIDVNSVVYTCNSTNTGYTVAFGVNDGDKPSYTFSGHPGTFNAITGIFTSTQVNNGSTFTIGVNDVNNCDPDAFTSSHTCPCTTDPGTMTISTGAPLEFCQSQPATAAHNRDQVLDGNDTLSFILSTSRLNPIGTRISVSKVPSFTFNPSLQAGTIYYISPIAGDNDGSGIVDFQNGCRLEGLGTAVVWLPEPSVSISAAASEICQGDSLLMTSVVNTWQGKQVTYTVTAQGYSSTFTSNSGNSFLIPDPSATLAGDSLKVDVVTSSVKYSASPGCPGIWDPAIRVTAFVIPTPTATLINASHIICPQETMPLNFTSTGHGDISVTHDGASSPFTVAAGSPYQMILPVFSSPQQRDYHITQVSSHSPGGTTCRGNYSGLVSIEVKASPSASAQFVNDTICLGSDSKLFFTANGATSPFTVHYQSDGVRDSVEVPATGNSIDYIRPAASVHVVLDSVVDNTVSAATGRGCATVLATPVLLKVNSLPAAYISGGGPVCEGDSAQVTITSNGGQGPYRVYYTGNSIVPASGNESRWHTPVVTTIYTLDSIFDSNGCPATSLQGSAQITVNPIPVPRFSASDTSNCSPLITILQNVTDTTGLGSISCTWEIAGDAPVQDCSRQTVTLIRPGTYPVRLAVKSAAGCTAVYEDLKFLTVHGYPEAAFSYDPPVSTFIDPQKRFYNHSEGADSSKWSIFDEGGAQIYSTDREEFIYQFSDSAKAVYLVRLVVASEFGCMDSTQQYVLIDGEMFIYTPNAFTPNNDGLNDVFLPVVSGLEPGSYELMVFNRWGEMVFYSTDPTRGWDGRFNGETVKPDNFAYKLKAKSVYSKEKQEVMGSFRMIR